MRGDYEIRCLIPFCVAIACNTAGLAAAAWIIHTELPTLVTYAVAVLTSCYLLTSAVILWREWYSSAPSAYVYNDAAHDAWEGRRLWFSAA